ncbi:hypothetical protein [Castellaniella sp.]|uniref:hypothetical protein n=1 Tax=Castellaniella sp. TaxID=1955812 RepID=UPI002AFE61A7|nr:hypothetical protein [Castellaniella sp.]
MIRVVHLLEIAALQRAGGHADLLRRLGGRLVRGGMPGEAMGLNGQSLELDLARVWPFGAFTPGRVDQFWRGLRADLGRDPIECGVLRFYPALRMDLWGLGPGLDIRDEAPLPAAGVYAGLAHQWLEADLRLAAQWLDDLRGGDLALAFRPVCRVVPDGAGDADGRAAACRQGYCLSYSLASPRRLADPDAPAVGAVQALERLGLVRRLDWSMLWTLVSLLETDPVRRVGCGISAMTFHPDAYWRELLSYLDARPSLAPRLAIELSAPRATPHAVQAAALALAFEARGAHVLVRGARGVGWLDLGPAELRPAWCGPAAPCLISDRASEYGGT